MRSADAAFSLYSNVNFNGFVARTRTQGRDDDDVGYKGRFSYDGDRYGAQLETLSVGDRFNPEVGFLRRTDFKQSFASARFSPRPKSIQSVRQFTLQGNFTYLLNGAGDLETRTRQLTFNTELDTSDSIGVEVTNNHELLVKPFKIATGVTIPVGAYDFTDAKATYLVGGQRRSNGTFTLQAGHFYGGTIRSFGLTQGRVALLKQFSLEPSVALNWIDLPEGAFRTALVRTRANYSFTPWMFVSGLVQYNSASHVVSSNLRFRWEYTAGSELFVVYTDAHDTDALTPVTVQNRALVVKINRLLRF